MLHDEFFERIERDDLWYFFSPHEAIGLPDAVGDDFSKLYCDYIEKFKSTAPHTSARLVFNKIVQAIAQGKMYIVFKDTTNLHSNQRGLGVIHNLNLCVEIAQVTSDTAMAVCTLGTISFPGSICKINFTCNNYYYYYYY